jgi:hypothetical protein
VFAKVNFTVGTFVLLAPFRSLDRLIQLKLLKILTLNSHWQPTKFIFVQRLRRTLNKPERRIVYERHLLSLFTLFTHGKEKFSGAETFFIASSRGFKASGKIENIAPLEGRRQGWLIKIISEL